jgi:membrane protein implicated in regulation of membrane protease activity
MNMRVPNLGVLLISLAVGALAIYVGNAVVAAVCFSIATIYTFVILWRWRRGRKK